MDTERRTSDDLLDNPDNLLNRLALPSRSRGDLVELPAELTKRRGVGERGRTIPFPERVLIGVSAHTDRQVDVAAAFGVPQSTVSHAKNAKVGGSTTSPTNSKLAAAVDAGLAPLRAKTADKIDAILNGITEEKITELGKESVQRMASAALTLATLHDKLTPKASEDKGNKVQVNIGNFSAGEQREDQYESIEVPLIQESEA